MRKIAIIAACLALAGCETTQTPAPVVTVSGPSFAVSEFKCPKKPAPPDAQHRTADDANRYEDRLEYRGDVCQSRMNSVERKLDAAGQVVR